MAEAHGDASAAARDVVDLQGAVTADEVKDIGGIHGGGLWMGEKRKLAFTGFDPYDLEYSDDEEYEYDSGEDVYKGNFASFTAKEIL
ncbi:hypothetical protein D1007_50159 [Hordeum vulgare]|nr:hypothetical protein D1007_50159 [Hordeum vulgare]